VGSARWFRLGIGLLLVIVPLWILFSRLDAIWSGHPAYPAILLAAGGVGLTLIAFVFLPWRLEPEPNGPPWETDNKPTPAPVHSRNRGWRLIGRVAIAILVIALLGILAWLGPSPADANSMTPAPFPGPLIVDTLSGDAAQAAGWKLAR